MAQWVQAMQDRIARGESIKDFCARQGISRNTYFYWQRKLREAACENLSPANRAEANTALVPKGWAVCEPSQSVATGSAVVIEIGICRVVVGIDVSAEQLEKVCRVLMKLC